MKSKLFLQLLVTGTILLIFPKISKSEVKIADPTDISAYPYVVLVLQNTKGDASKINGSNGILLSLNKVLTVNAYLAALIPGKVEKGTAVVYAGQSSIDMKNLESNPETFREVSRVESQTLLPGANKHFPNLVVLELVSPFVRNSTVQPGTINVGKLNFGSTVVGWGMDSQNKVVDGQLRQIAVHPLTYHMCALYDILVHPVQFCASPSSPVSAELILLEGAPLIDQHRFTTGLLEFTTGTGTKNEKTSMGLMALLRLTYFRSYIEFNEQEVQETWLRTKYADDLVPEPWNVKGRRPDQNAATRPFSRKMSTTNVVLLVYLFFVDTN